MMSRDGVRWIALGALLWLGGCATPPPRPTASDQSALRQQAERERQLDAHATWSLEGRVAIRSGDEGGSGQLSWRVDQGHMELALRAPVSGQGWRLKAGAGEAVLEGLDAGPLRGADPDRLLREAAGWDVPVHRLVRWVRGQRGATDARVEFDQEGLPARIHEAGWDIHYRAWDHAYSPPLPRRIDATSGDRRVRLVIRDWQGLPRG